MKQPRSRVLRWAATAVAALIVLSVTCEYRPDGRQFRRIAERDMCPSIQVFTSPHERDYVGFLITRATIPDGNREVAAIDLSVIVDRGARSVWRPEQQVMSWYVYADRPSCPLPGDPGYRGMFSEDPDRRATPSRLEFTLHQPIWRRHVLGGWSSRRLLAWGGRI